MYYPYNLSYTKKVRTTESLVYISTSRVGTHRSFVFFTIQFCLSVVISWRKKWQSTPVFLPGEFHAQRILAGYSPWGRKVSDPTKWLTHTQLSGCVVRLFIHKDLYLAVFLFVFLSKCLMISWLRDVVIYMTIPGLWFHVLVLLSQIQLHQLLLVYDPVHSHLF